ncbi:hypothetical protein MBLNU459_g4619t1 [Dothideomycetes sp. NU459]
MDGREIPGFYYDPDKKKYFQIQANHVAPQGSKYSRDNVKREHEQSRVRAFPLRSVKPFWATEPPWIRQVTLLVFITVKSIQAMSKMVNNSLQQKRKYSAALQQKKETQTVQRSKVLSSPAVAGITLWREQGASRIQNFDARSAALASQTQGAELLSLKSCESCGMRDKIYDFAVDFASDALIWGLGSQNHGRLQYVADQDAVFDLAAFRSDISSVCVTGLRTVMATSMSSYHPGNVFVAALSESTGPNDFPILDAPAASYTMLGPEETSLWTSSPSPPGGRDFVAVGGSGQTYLLSADGRPTQTYDVGEDVRSIDWLTPSVAVGGTRNRRVFLWDSRTGGSSARFNHKSGVTAVRSLGDGSQVLVCGFAGMSVYDVRMPTKLTLRSRGDRSASAPLLDLPFSTSYPSNAMDVSPEAKIVATAADDNTVQLHSLASGKLIGSLGKPDHSLVDGRIQRIRFLNSYGGRPTLTVCQGSNLMEWSWGGDKDDEG